MSIYDVNGNVVGGNGSNDGIRHRPYWILLLDCGRKYFSVANIKRIIDAMQANELNQLELHFVDNRGLRFALDDMLFVDIEGNEYDLEPCVSTDLGGSLTQSDMDEIIVYARSKGIDIVPSFDMPGHMTPILSTFTQFRYNGSSWVLDATNPLAVKFGLAIAYKYAKYFAQRGCKFWNIGADEIGNGGKWTYIPSESRPVFVDFINSVAELVTSMGMTPRAFNDGVLYDGDYQCLFNKNIEIMVWCNSTLMNEPIQNSATLIKNGYSLINTSWNYYYILPRDNNGNSGSNRNLSQNNLLKNFYNGTTEYDQDGACCGIWCDNDTTADGGNASMTGILSAIESMGIGITLSTEGIDYPII